MCAWKTYFIMVGCRVCVWNYLRYELPGLLPLYQWLPGPRLPVHVERSSVGKSWLNTPSPWSHFMLMFPTAVLPPLLSPEGIVRVRPCHFLFVFVSLSVTQGAQKKAERYLCSRQPILQLRLWDPWVMLSKMREGNAVYWIIGGKPL